jgi:2-(3-amino-3-carboxypropyl)histidine synthase
MEVKHDPHNTDNSIDATEDGEQSKETSPPLISPTNPTRRVVRRRRGRKKKDIHAIPESISQNKALISAIESSLPSDYEFEVLKTIHRVQTSKANHVALQMPEGLLMYACTIADILKKFSEGELQAVSILGDVTYGGEF